MASRRNRSSFRCLAGTRKGDPSVQCFVHQIVLERSANDCMVKYRAQLPTGDT